MRKNILLLLCLVLHYAMAWGQTDQQVLNYARQRYESGIELSQVISELADRGVPEDQILRVQKQFSEIVKVSAPGRNSDVQRTRQAQSFSAQEADAAASNYGSSEVFGRSIFNTKLLSFEPNMNLPTPQNYVLGPGDQLIVDIYGASQVSKSYSVSPDGFIMVDGCGPISVTGLTVAQAAQRIKSKVGALYTQSNVNVSLGKTRSIRVHVMGEVKVPGSYTVSSFATVFHALYLAGGIDEIGSLREVRLYRNSKQISSIDVYEYILNGRMEGNILLQEGDVVSVSPYGAIVKLAGEVKRPMSYEMKGSETLADLLRYAGGTTGKAFQEQIRVDRFASAGRSVHNVGLSDRETFLLMDGDNVTVEGNRTDRFENTVEVKGAVMRPGYYQMGASLQSVGKLIERAGGLDEQSVAANAVLYRMLPDRTLQAIRVDLEAILSGRASDMALQNEDQLFVPSRTRLIQQRKVAIYGEVFSPGEFAYAEGETLEELVVRAGGLLETASALSVEVVRKKFDALAQNPLSQEVETFQLTVCDGVINREGAPSRFEVQPYDMVFVRRSPASRAIRHAAIEGEAVFAGSYSLPDHQQRLSDLVARAGGLTQYAFVRNARLVRRRSAEEMAVLKTVKEQVALNKNDSVDSGRLSDAATYQVGIRLDKALANPGGDDDILLQDGDRLIVPEYNAIVSVGGEVLTPNTLRYREGKRFRYYVREAGGYTSKAKRRKAFVVYPNGVNDRARKAKIQPGCQIVVPAKEEKRFDLEKTSRLITISSSIATTCAVLVSVLK